MSKTLTITFASGAGTVTGANFLVGQPAADGGVKILVDCGLLQGLPEDEAKNWNAFPYDPSTVKALLVTHAHIDHIGRIPKLVADGFSGTIYSTAPTRMIAQEMLADMGRILAHDEDAKQRGIDQMYSQEKLQKIFERWVDVSYHQEIDLTHGIVATLYNAGHILGSAMVALDYQKKRILFTGDLGNSPSPILPDTESVPRVSYLVTESVYGDRNHETRSMRREKLKQALLKNKQQGGVLLMPMFSLDRTQEILFEINELVEHGEIPEMPIFLDSPLAIRLTRIYKQFQSYFNEEAQEALKHDDDIFFFPGLEITEHTDASKKIRHTPNPKVIIAGAGMSTGGRIVFHERDFLPDPNNTILLTGYQTVGTPGRVIEEGAKHVELLRERIPVRAAVNVIKGYSGHKDSEHLLSFIETFTELEQAFMTLGEPKSSLFLAQRVHDYLGIEAVVPKPQMTVTLSF